MSEDYFILTFIDDELKLLICALSALVLATDDDDLIDSCLNLSHRILSKLGGI